MRIIMAAVCWRSRTSAHLRIRSRRGIDMHGETAETKRAFSRAALWDRWRCPDCNSTALAEHPDEVICGGCGTRYPLATGRPVLIRTDNVLFPRDCYLSAPGTVVSRQGARRFVPE